jgi:general secretion pathway protein G
MAEQGCSDLRDTNSRSTCSTGNTKTSAAALWSSICSIAAPILLMILITYRRNWNSENIRTIVFCFMLLIILLSIVLGIVALVLIHKSAGRLKGSGFAICGLVLSAIWSIGLLAAIILPMYAERLGPSKSIIAKIQIEEFEQVLEAYAHYNGSFPTNEQGLEALLSNKGKGPYLRKRLPIDPWGRPYRYRNPGVRNPGSYDIWSNGKDGIEETADDIANYK